MRNGWAAFAIAALAGSLEGSAAAQQTAIATLFDQARADRDAQRFEAACPKFQEVYKAEPEKLGLLYTVADCYQKWGKRDDAVGYYEAFIAHVAQLPEDRQAPYGELVALAQQALQTFGVKGTEAPPLDVPAVEAPPTGSQPQVANIQESVSPPIPSAKAGPSQRATPPDSSGNTSRYGVVPWVLMAGGGALAGSAIVTGILALSKEDTLADACPTKQDCDPALQSTGRTASGLAHATDILWVAAAVTAGVGVTLFVIDSPRSTAEGLAAEAGCFGNGCGISARGSF